MSHKGHLKLVKLLSSTGIQHCTGSANVSMVCNQEGGQGWVPGPRGANLCRRHRQGGTRQGQNYSDKVSGKEWLHLPGEAMCILLERLWLGSGESSVVSSCLVRT